MNHYVQFKRLLSHSNLSHAFTTIQMKNRQLGQNFAFNRGSYDDTIKNYRQVFSDLSINENKIAYIKQIHGDFVLAIDEKNAFSLTDRHHRLEQGDALITNQAGICLISFHADCYPIFLYDKKKLSIGLVHSGWRGTFLEIAKKTVKQMMSLYQTDPKDLVAVIGPGISKKNFIVDKTIYDQFKKKFGSLILDQEQDIHRIDLQSIILNSLLTSGVQQKNIEISDICTVDDRRFFSHRRQGEERGSMAAFFCMQNKKDGSNHEKNHTNQQSKHCRRTGNSKK